MLQPSRDLQWLMVDNQSSLCAIGGRGSNGSKWLDAMCLQVCTEVCDGSVQEAYLPSQHVRCDVGWLVVSNAAMSWQLQRTRR